MRKIISFILVVNILILFEINSVQLIDSKGNLKDEMNVERRKRFWGLFKTDKEENVDEVESVETKISVLAQNYHSESKNMSEKDMVNLAFLVKILVQQKRLRDESEDFWTFRQG